jgi:hypothetical protein
LVPVTDNPVTLTLLKISEMDRYVMAHQALQGFDASGVADFFPLGRKAPPNWVQIKDPIGTSYRCGEGGETILNGHWYAPEGAAPPE